MTDPTHSRPAHPFSLRLDVLDRMLNFELADDPHYTGLEIQGFDDPVHGRGTLVFLNRRDDATTDVYAEPGLRLDRDTYAIGGGLGRWIETRFDVARLDVGPKGVDAEVRFTDADGRAIEVRAGDRTPRGRATAAFLAPMGAAITRPRSLPLVWMPRFDLLRRSGPPPVIRIDGREARPGRLPLEPLTRRRLVKVASDLCAVSVNPSRDEATPLETVTAGVDTVAGGDGTAAVVGTAGGHEARLAFDPDFPDLGDLAAVRPGRGEWTISIDGTAVIAGTWQTTPVHGAVGVDLEVTRGWRPKGLPLLMAIVTRVAPVFRRWPTTYRWTATVTGGPSPTMTSRWVRTGSERGESYRALTGSG
jgi:hypothetical protein